MVIWKFPLALHGRTAVDMPKGARVLDVQNQRGVLVLWALVDPIEDTALRRFDVVMTGENEYVRESDLYVGTVQFEKGAFVVHVFEAK